MSGGVDGTPYNSTAFNRWNDDERNVNVNRNDNDWNDNWWFAGCRNSLHFSPRLRVGLSFCELSVPAAEHLADLIKWEGESDIFLRIK